MNKRSGLSHEKHSLIFQDRSTRFSSDHSYIVYCKPSVPISSGSLAISCEIFVVILNPPPGLIVTIASIPFFPVTLFSLESNQAKSLNTPGSLKYKTWFENSLPCTQHTKPGGIPIYASTTTCNPSPTRGGGVGKLYLSVFQHEGNPTTSKNSSENMLLSLNIVPFSSYYR